jgi:hypothetical protein
VVEASTQVAVDIILEELDIVPDSVGRVTSIVLVVVNIVLKVGTIGEAVGTALEKEGVDTPELGEVVSNPTLVQMHSFQSCYVDKKVAGCIEAVVAVD